MALECPKCCSKDHRVVDSRPRAAPAFWRRRLCEKCGHRFSTIEKIQTGRLDCVVTPSMAVKIKAMRRNQMKWKDIAKSTGVSITTAWKVYNGLYPS